MSNPVPVSVDIVDVGPRDGLQMEPEVLPTTTKIEFVTRLVDAGLRRLEVASFVNPKRVPQMADAEDVVAGLPARDDVTYIGLILNQRGFDRALAAGVDEVGFVVVASDTFNRRNQGVSTEESVAAWHSIAAAARSAGIRANVTISTAFGCPFEGEIAEDRVVEIAKALATSAPVDIAIADTVGVAVPAQVSSMIRRVREALPQMPLRCHFHNTRNTGLANAYTAVLAGVETLDASTGGIGGCPFAPAATGNIPTEDLLYMLHRSGIETGLSLERVIETGDWLQQQIGRPVPSMLTKAGPFPAAENAA
ncbi:MAG: hydroxymethylglutaryl-CoA lyase [Gammaproteobacteria bacterium]